LIENNLDYDFDPQTNLITVFSAVSQQMEQAVVPLSFVSPSEVRSAAKRFNLGGEISVDSASRTAFVQGTKEQVKVFEGLVKRLDAAAGAR
jgi:type II secretory pathway component GspD/PulD (secretin)